jgi:hypothetical protein
MEQSAWMGHYNGGTHTAYSELGVPGARGSLYVQNACRWGGQLLRSSSGLVNTARQSTNPSMSEMGHKRTSAAFIELVRFVPEADMMNGPDPAALDGLLL